MGATNFIMLLFGIPFIYGAALAIVIYERAQGWMVPVQKELLYQFGVTPDKYPIVILLISVALWQFSFFLSTYVAAINRDKAWDNSTTRDCPEKQVGLSYRFYCGHLNEGEQFRYFSVAVIIALILYYQISNSQEQKLTMEFINYCCTGYIVHRILFHIMFMVNIDILRSTFFGVSFWYTIILFISSIYGIMQTNQRLDIMIPPAFKDVDLFKIIQGFTNPK